MFDFADRLERLSQTGAPLEAPDRHIDFEVFRPVPLKAPRAIVGDKGYDSDTNRAMARERGAIPLYAEDFSEKSIDFKQSFQADENGTMRTVVEVPNITSLTDEERFLCARFVQRELRKGGSTSETLARIASIGLLTEVVQDFVRPTDAVKHTDLVVYLDGPIALEFLGVSGRAARENTVPVVKELKRIKAQVRIFAQSLDEMRTALYAVLQSPQPTGPTAQALARGEVLREYVSRIANDPTQFLEDEGVAVTHRTLDQVPSEERHFTLENRDAIVAAQTFQQALVLATMMPTSSHYSCGN